jgi:hypothetical protein
MKILATTAVIAVSPGVKVDTGLGFIVVWNISLASYFVVEMSESALNTPMKCTL